MCVLRRRISAAARPKRNGGNGTDKRQRPRQLGGALVRRAHRMAEGTVGRKLIVMRADRQLHGPDAQCGYRQSASAQAAAEEA